MGRAAHHPRHPRWWRWADLEPKDLQLSQPTRHRRPTSRDVRKGTAHEQTGERIRAPQHQNEQQQQCRQRREHRPAGMQEHRHAVITALVMHVQHRRRACRRRLLDRVLDQPATVRGTGRRGSNHRRRWGSRGLGVLVRPDNVVHQHDAQRHHSEQQPDARTLQPLARTADVSPSARAYGHVLRLLRVRVRALDSGRRDDAPRLTEAASASATRPACGPTEGDPRQQGPRHRRREDRRLEMNSKRQQAPLPTVA